MQPFYLTILLLFFFQINGFSQKISKIYFSKSDPSKMYENDHDSTALHYYQLVPSGKIKNVLVALPGAFETTEQVMKDTRLPLMAMESDFLVIIPSLNWGTFTLTKEHAYLDTIVKQVIRENKLTNQKWAIGGFSKGGMLAVSYAEYARLPGTAAAMTPAAVFGVDPPLDLAGLWKRAQKDIDRSMGNSSVFEARWVQRELNKDFGGSPKEFYDNYLKYSPFLYGEKEGGNARYLQKVPILIYTEPDIEWQMKNRHRDYYDLNAADISAMINLLQQSGNKTAQMITTHGKGYRANGERHPHSWSILDPKECLDWLQKMME